MKRAKAVHAVEHAAEVCSEASTGGLDTLRELWVHGALLAGDVGDELPEAVVTLDLGVDVVPWRVTPREGDALITALQARKIPLHLLWRSWRGPIGNHHIRRPLRVWTHQGGTDEDALAVLAKPPVSDSLRAPDPDPADLFVQLEAEAAVSRAHLRAAVGDYWDPAWRRDHRGPRRYPEHHLWEAAGGYLELLSALETRP